MDCIDDAHIEAEISSDRLHSMTPTVVGIDLVGDELQRANPDSKTLRNLLRRMLGAFPFTLPVEKQASVSGCLNEIEKAQFDELRMQRHVTKQTCLHRSGLGSEANVWNCTVELYVDFSKLGDLGDSGAGKSAKPWDPSFRGRCVSAFRCSWVLASRWRVGSTGAQDRARLGVGKSPLARHSFPGHPHSDTIRHIFLQPTGLDAPVQDGFQAAHMGVSNGFRRERHQQFVLPVEHILAGQALSVVVLEKANQMVDTRLPTSGCLSTAARTLQLPCGVTPLPRAGLRVEAEFSGGNVGVPP